MCYIGRHPVFCVLKSGWHEQHSQGGNKDLEKFHRHSGMMMRRALDTRSILPDGKGKRARCHEERAAPPDQSRHLCCTCTEQGATNHQEKVSLCVRLSESASERPEKTHDSIGHQSDIAARGSVRAVRASTRPSHPLPPPLAPTDPPLIASPPQPHRTGYAMLGRRR